MLKQLILQSITRWEVSFGLCVCWNKQREQTDLGLCTCRHELRACSAKWCHWSELCKAKSWSKTFWLFPGILSTDKKRHQFRPQLHATKYNSSGPKLDPKYISTCRNSCYLNNIQLSVAEWCVFLLWVLQMFIKLSFLFSFSINQCVTYLVFHLANWREKQINTSKPSKTSSFSFKTESCLKIVYSSDCHLSQDWQNYCPK